MIAPVSLCPYLSTAIPKGTKYIVANGSSGRGLKWSHVSFIFQRLRGKEGRRSKEKVLRAEKKVSASVKSHRTKDNHPKLFGIERMEDQ
jgi:hypothetical protein